MKPVIFSDNKSVTELWLIQCSNCNWIGVGEGWPMSCDKFVNHLDIHDNGSLESYFEASMN